MEKTTGKKPKSLNKVQQKSELRAQRRHYLCRKLLNALSGYWRSICGLCWSGLWKHTFLCVGLSGTNLLVFADDISLSVKYHPPAAFGTPNSVVVVVVSLLQLACRACVCGSYDPSSRHGCGREKRRETEEKGKEISGSWAHLCFFFFTVGVITRGSGRRVSSLCLIWKTAAAPPTAGRGFLCSNSQEGIWGQKKGQLLQNNSSCFAAEGKWVQRSKWKAS